MIIHIIHTYIYDLETKVLKYFVHQKYHVQKQKQSDFLAIKKVSSARNSNVYI
jgi:hypothetical protein